MHEKQPTRTFLVPAEDFHEIADHYEVESLKLAYIGRWANRAAFGAELFADSNADRRIADLPRWMRAYVRLDGDAYVADLEADGIYVLAPGENGVHVFDAATIRPKAESQ